MLYSLDGTRPRVADDTFVAPSAQVIGAVTLAPESSVWFQAVLRGDADSISVGRGSNIQDLTLVHADQGLPTVIGENVTVGHSCIIHGCEIGDNCLVGMGSTILNGAKLGSNCLVGAGSLITEGKEFPPGSVIMGRPAKVVREVGERELEMIRRGAQSYRENARRYLQGFESV